MAGRLLEHSNNKVHWITHFIRRERVRRGLSQKALSDRIGTHHQHISNYETGYYGIRAIYTVERILMALGYELHIRKVKDKKGAERDD